MKVGDRVIGKGRWLGKKVEGIKGVVVDIRPETTDPFAVKWDVNIGGHDCDGKCEDGYGWWVKEMHLKLLPPLPEFKVGDKVVPVSKSVPGYCSFERCCQWKKAKDAQGFLYVSSIYRDGKIECSSSSSRGMGNFYLPSDLRPYDDYADYRARIEACVAKEKVAEATNVYQVSIPTQRVREFNTVRIHFTPRNRAPENFSTDWKGGRLIVNENTTVFVYSQDGRKYKGVAKCAPTDKFNIETGKWLAYSRAMVQYWQAEEARLAGRG